MKFYSFLKVRRRRAQVDLECYYFEAKFRNNIIEKFVRRHSKRHPLISKTWCIYVRLAISDCKILCPLPHCVARIEQLKELAQHIKSAHCLLHSYYQYRCKCGAIFNTLKLVQKHFKENHTEDMFCKTCSGSYQNLERHIQEYRKSFYRIAKLEGMNISKRIIG